MSFIIEKNIPLDAPISQLDDKFPLVKMEIGDSFFIPKEDFIGYSTQEHIYYHAKKIRKKHPERRFVTKRFSTGLRVWRVK